MEQIEGFISNLKVLYETSDAPEIIVLLYFGIEPVDISPHYEDRRRKVFRFEKTEELVAIFERLARGQLLVEASRFLNANKHFKDLIRRSEKFSRTCS